MKKRLKAIAVILCVCAAFWFMWDVSLEMDEGLGIGSSTPATITLVGNARVEGIVLTDDGQPMEATVVAHYRLETGEKRSQFANANADGHYAIEGLAAGPATLFVFLPGERFTPLLVVPVTLIEGETIEQDVRIPAGVE